MVIKFVDWEINVFPLMCTVPPDIINEDSSMDMAVQENEDAALTCRATGKRQLNDFLYSLCEEDNDECTIQFSLS